MLCSLTFFSCRTQKSLLCYNLKVQSGSHRSYLKVSSHLESYSPFHHLSLLPVLKQTTQTRQTRSTFLSHMKDKLSGSGCTYISASCNAALLTPLNVLPSSWTTPTLEFVQSDPDGGSPVRMQSGICVLVTPSNKITTNDHKRL